MISKKLKRNDVTDPIATMDWPALSAYLDTLSKSELKADKICSWIIRAENIVCKHVNKTRERDRKSLLTDLESYFRTHVGAKDAEIVRTVHDRVLMLEDGYRKIWRARLTGGVESLAPEERVSGVFWTAETVLSQAHVQTNAFLADAKSFGNTVDVTDEDGNPVNADAELSGVCHIATMTCHVEGFANKWFNKEGILVLPSIPKLTKSKQSLSEKASFNAFFWRNWQTVDEHIRFLGGDIQYFQTPKLPDWVGTNHTEAGEYRLSDSPIERLDMIANDRSKRKFVQNFLQMLLGTGISSQISGLSKPMAIGPGLFVSEAEAFTYIALSETLYHNVIQDFRLYHGLRLAEWVRGYAVLQQFLAEQHVLKKPDTLFPQLPRQDWSDMLQKFGMARVKAEKFLDLVLFTKTSRDLYDCPLIAISNGDLCLFGASLKDGNLAEIVMSALSRKETVFEDKGPDFENYMLDFLNKQPNVVAKTYSTKIAGEQYQFDIIMQFDGMVFLFELKNRSLSSGAVQRVYYDFKRVEDDIKQTGRLAKALEDNPSILDDLFGQGISNLPRIDSLLYARPYSFPGGIEDIFIFDAQSLERFFKVRHLNFSAVHDLDGKKIQMDVPVADFWKQDTPSAKALCEQIKLPHQVDLALSHLAVGHVFSEVGAKKVFVREEHRSEQMTSESVAAHFGADLEAMMSKHGELESEVSRARNSRQVDLKKGEDKVLPD